MKKMLKTDKVKNKFYNFIKKVLVTTIITTNIVSYFPIVSFGISEGDKRYPATVPAVANEIISKYVNTIDYGDENISGTGVITNYEESGDGWQTITKVEYPNGKTRTYRNYKQFRGSYRDDGYWGGTIWTQGCGPTALAIVASGYKYDISPGGIVEKKYIEQTGPSTMSEALNSLGLENEYKVGVGNVQAVANEISENIKNGRPVLVGIKAGTKYSPGQHWMVIVGIKDGKLVISNGGSDEEHTDTLEDFISNYLNSYIIVKEDDDNAGSSGSSSRKKTKAAGTGQATTAKAKLENDGYDTIFTSGTTGRQFKEFKQNIGGWDSKYNITRCKL